MFCELTTCIKDYIITDIYKTLWKVLSTVKLLILKYKGFAACYTTLALNSHPKDKVADIEYIYILLYINNAFNKLFKYKELLL